MENLITASDVIYEVRKKTIDQYMRSCVNHSGSAGKMEIDAIIEMFLNSVNKHGVKYTTYIGDSKTFKDAQLHGDSITVQKKNVLSML